MPARPRQPLRRLPLRECLSVDAPRQSLGRIRRCGTQRDPLRLGRDVRIQREDRSVGGRSNVGHQSIAGARRDLAARRWQQDDLRLFCSCDKPLVARRFQYLARSAFESDPLPDQPGGWCGWLAGLVAVQVIHHRRPHGCRAGGPADIPHGSAACVPHPDAHGVVA